MSYFNSSNQHSKQFQLSHKQIILQQILICNNLFSGYETTPNTLDPILGTLDYKAQAHSAKAILLGVLTLEANARALLPQPFPERAEKLKQKILTKGSYTDPNHKNSPSFTYKFFAPTPATQLEGIIEIWELYREILDAIYSLPKFSDAINYHQFASTEDNMTEKDISIKESVEFEEQPSE